MKKILASLPRTLFAASLSAGLLIGLTACPGNKDKAAPHFSADVAPILKQHCAECHLSGGKGFEASGFSVESYDTIMKGTRLGPVIIAGQSVSSTLVRLIEGKADPSIRMPHGKDPLDAAKIKIIKNWVDAGAKNN